METFLWVEEYRPKTIDSCILPSELKKTFSDYIRQGNVNNMILSGPAGVGKTTVARALVEEMGCTYMIINGSEESGIDVLRTKIKNFASTVSLEGGRKYIILDEADYLNPQSTQPALRGFMEEFHKNCGFILTCNYKNRLIEPLHSRCPPVEFIIPKAEKPQLAKEFMERVLYILEDKGIKCNKKVVSELILKFFPDWRRTLNELQRYAVSGEIDAGILVDISQTNVKTLMTAMKNKEFTNVRKWVVDNLDNDAVRILRVVYDNLYEYVDGSSIPHVVVVLGEYQYKSAFVADQEINMLACMTEIMARAKFK
jgi:DNA polymerase III delta prime subunit|tara:strand:- start:2422 stop:3357 length:936 start_codon:yes stop_codon:yes gene_type:complete